MDQFQLILQNALHFILYDAVYKYILGIIALLFVFDILGYMFTSNKDKSDSILARIKKYIVGIIVIILFPFVLAGLPSIIHRATGINPSIDTSIIDNVIKENPVKNSTTNTNTAPAGTTEKK